MPHGFREADSAQQRVVGEGLARNVIQPGRQVYLPQPAAGFEGMRAELAQPAGFLETDGMEIIAPGILIRLDRLGTCRDVQHGINHAARGLHGQAMAHNPGEQCGEYPRTQGP